ncbi:MAG: phosphatase PAP2 family protein [Hydrogenophaga sp.]|jgi:undecaprenyl-diphosphatase|uniref:phosphatase PAP2 family protein n=1 Tax=Hydrogenophaga sp. TaxID=1904254 RepID=UPI002725E5B7|nr:phosphatase PAP2 family protein [Hydrogenophaga sp.]MDO9484263.1 phosphatase PAP2 family protein [Hydrogenophaga sp.]MDO9567995.1 phosphatase PAP2 family protein [Hydrogenophaga sp.]MDP2219892.1 phosphatase PAP2 family protein [Hydrogenophaga sp.]MDP3345981.1 phosphatase PAP2 family protein [Hydrogenophaga sp.]MDP3375624.1 phosphatase PAP2 family protein [Hydrogenophaga sp.]
MTALHHLVFFWINLTPASPTWLMGLARLCSTALPVGLLLFVLLLLVVGPTPWRRMALHMLWAMVLAWLITSGLADLFPSPRPFALGLGHLGLAHKATPSFPSSHASVACALAAVAWHLAPHPLARWPVVCLALLVAWSRVALGMHFPIDILAGAVIGVASAVLALSWASLTAQRNGRWHGRRLP